MRPVRKIVQQVCLLSAPFYSTDNWAGTAQLRIIESLREHGGIILQAADVHLAVQQIGNLNRSLISRKNRTIIVSAMATLAIRIRAQVYQLLLQPHYLYLLTTFLRTKIKTAIISNHI